MGHFWLEFDNNGHRQRYDFNQASVTIGREQTCDFHLDHPTVSRQHATIVDSAGSFQLVVMSTNGLTAVDGEKVQGTVPLRPGMTLQVGEVQLGFRAAIGAAGVGEVATEQFSLNQVNTHAPTAAMPVIEESTAPSQGGLPSWQAALNAPEPQPGFGGQPQQGFGGTAPQPGFGAAPPQGFGAAQGGAPQAPVIAPPNGGGGGEDEFKIKSWEDIAAEATTGAHEAVGGMTDFQRIQKAQAKANKKTEGTSPVMLAVLVLAVGGVAAMFLMDGGPKAGKEETSALPDRCAQLRICYPEEKEPKCANKSDCMSRAQNAYNVAEQLYAKKDADLTNRYEAYKQLDEAGRFMAQADVAEPPESMKDYEKRLLAYEKELDKIHQEHKIRDHKKQQRKMFWDKARNIRAWQAYFPDTYNTWYQEAIEAERAMKNNGTWPKKFDKRPKIKKH